MFSCLKERRRAINSIGQPGLALDRTFFVPILLNTVPKTKKKSVLK